MKTSTMKFILLAGLLSMLLSACGGAVISNSWPNISADSELVYLAAGGQAYGVRLSDGGQAWAYPEKADNRRIFWAPPTQLPSGDLLLASYDHKLYAVDAQTGVEKWSFAGPKDRLVGAPLVTEDTIYQPSADGYLYALDLSGTEKWKFRSGQPLWSTPVANGGNLYLASMDHYLYAIDKATGEQAWSADLGAAIPSAPVLSDEVILYVGTIGGELLAVDGKTGAVLWREALEGGIWSSPLLHEGTLYVGTQNGKLYAIDADTGATLAGWPLDLESPVLSTPVLSGENMVVALENGTIQAVDFSAGLGWSDKINGKLYSHPVVAGDRILFAVTGTDQRLVAYDTQGSLLWSYPPEEK